MSETTKSYWFTSMYYSVWLRMIGLKLCHYIVFHIIKNEFVIIYGFMTLHR